MHGNHPCICLQFQDHEKNIYLHFTVHHVIWPSHFLTLQIAKTFDINCSRMFILRFQRIFIVTVVRNPRRLPQRPYSSQFIASNGEFEILVNNFNFWWIWSEHVLYFLEQYDWSRILVLFHKHWMRCRQALESNWSPCEFDLNNTKEIGHPSVKIWKKMLAEYKTVTQCKWYH